MKKLQEFLLGLMLILGWQGPDQANARINTTATVSKTPATSASVDTADSDVIVNSIGMKLKLIPEGSFIMGSPETEIDRDHDQDPPHRYTDEGPQHKVTITKPFYMGVYEVTQAEYEKVMGSNPSEFIGPALPVEKVSYRDALDFCLRLTEQEKQLYRLPTEAEWEYACRAGTTTAYYWGPAPDDTYAWTNQNSGEKTRDVGTRKPNFWGLYDMAGNVWEWCRDWKGNYSAADRVDPRGPSGGEFRVLRGGSWAAYPLPFRSAARYGATPVSKINMAGFRVVVAGAP